MGVGGERQWQKVMNYVAEVWKLELLLRWFVPGCNKRKIYAEVRADSPGLRAFAPGIVTRSIYPGGDFPTGWAIRPARL